MSDSTKYKLLVADKYGWPIERVMTKRPLRHAVFTVQWWIRCAIHGRKIVRWKVVNGGVIKP